MATHRMNLLGGLAAPDVSGNVFPQGTTVKLTNDLWKGLAIVFNDTATKDGFAFEFEVPKEFVSGMKLVVKWATSVTSGNVEWEADYRAIAAAETIDPTTWQTTVASGAVAVPGTAWLLKETTLTLTDGDFAVDDKVFGHLSRKGSSGNDTAAAAVLMIGLELEFADA